MPGSECGLRPPDGRLGPYVKRLDLGGGVLVNGARKAWNTVPAPFCEREFALARFSVCRLRR